jgi:hypothetical protein
MDHVDPTSLIRREKLYHEVSKQYSAYHKHSCTRRIRQILALCVNVKQQRSND